MNKLKEMLLEDTEQLIELVQTINSYNGSLEHLELYDMDMFDELMGAYSEKEGAWQLACRVVYGNFNPAHDYFGFDGYENLVSYNDYEYQKMLKDCIDEIIEASEDVPPRYLPEWMKEYCD